LVLQNLALRQQLSAMKRVRRPLALNTRDRLFWIALAHSWRNWRTALVFVQPDTVVRWHRDWLRRRWTRRSKRRPPGRPPIDPPIRTLVREMATANPLWGAPRIHGELQTLGLDVSERTVSRLLAPLTRPRSQTWKTFLTNHLTSAAAMDFLHCAYAHRPRPLRRYYHRSRTHLGLEKDAPDPRPISPPTAGPIIAIPEVGGLHHRYERQAA
jgi:hypothetical protein